MARVLLNRAAMEPSLCTTSSGAPSLRVGDVWLDDPLDPVAAAVQFVRPEQVNGASKVIVFGAGLGYRLLRLKQMGVAAPVVFEPDPAVLALARNVLPDAFEGAQVFSNVHPFLTHLSGEIRRDPRIVLLAAPAYERAYPDAHAKVVAGIQEAIGFAKLKENTVGERLPGMMESALKNLPLLTQEKPALSLGTPLAGTPAFCVAAGPSLDRNAHLLAEASTKGAVFAVNTSAATVVKHRTTIDFLCSIEAISVADTLGAALPSTRFLTLDLSANPSGHALTGAEKLLFSLGSSEFAPFHDALGIEPIPYGASVATAAFMLAYRLGANPIVLLGQDLAFPGGRLYASGTGREDWSAERKGPVLAVAYDEALNEKFRAHGLREPPKHQPRLEVPAWGGEGTVDTTYDLSLFRRWFEGAAIQMGKDRRLINATEGGAHIDGFEELRLEDVLRSLPARSDRLDEAAASVAPIAAAPIESFRVQVRASAREVERLAGKLLTSSDKKAARSSEELKRALRRAPIVTSYASSALVKIERDEGSDKARRTVEALKKAAATIRNLVS